MALPVFVNINIKQIKPTPPDNNNNQRVRSTTKKCLFGAADPQDTNQLMEEQFKGERQRFFDRFGIYMEDLENVAVEQSPKKSDKLKILTERNSRRSRVLKPYNAQTKITDFCPVKKSPCPLQKKL